MGTGKTGRYLNTRGSGRTPSEFAIIHSSEGKFRKSQVRQNGKMTYKLRLEGGGHSEAGIKLLDKYNIPYNIVKTYPNGVRVGNIPSHLSKDKKNGNGQSWFPKTWSNKEIKRAGEHVAGLKANHHVQDGKKFMVYGKALELE